MLHQLKHTWTLYLHLPNETDWSINSYKKILTIQYVEELIELYKIITNKMVISCMFFLMKGNIKPMWEDPANCNGGAFSYKINHRISYSIWRTITYLAIGEQLDNTGKNIITGITISPKKNFSIIKIWVNTDKYTQVNTIQCPSSLNLTNCIFKKHLTT
tara:strand:+ start:8060 stop:8536 length:477 start_codon:yes stop_codon:yes gene_type:complete